MSCYFPVRAWKLPAPGSKLSFSPQGDPYITLEVPCGKCEGCRASQSLMWSIRAYHESTLHDRNSFVTLTYSDENLPSDGKIVKRDLQLFFKRLRKLLPPKSLKYIACGEYGDTTNRPHYHAILFGVDFLHDKITLKDDLYTSPTLEKVWGLGHVSLAPVNMSSICYVCGYVTKKIKNPDTFNLMSRRPGIGHDWLDKFKGDLLRTASVTIEGKEYPIPARYLDWDTESFEDVKLKRQQIAKQREHLNTDAALRNKRLNKLKSNSDRKEKL